MTEGNGHVIDPNGDARRALHEAVAEHGPEALSNAVLMDNVCRDHLSSLPGESILIGSAARTDVPALLRDLIPRLGNYGAIQSAAVTLAEEHELDIPACVWVVREFARALGHIAPRPATGGSGSLPGAAGESAGSGASPSAAPEDGSAASSNATAEAGHAEGSRAGVSASFASSGPPSAGLPAAGRRAAGLGEAGRKVLGARLRGRPWGGPGGGGAGSPGGPGLPPQGPGGAGASPPGGMPGSPSGGPPGRRPEGSRVFNRNTLGVAAAIALVAGYLGVAAVAHLSPFPADDGGGDLVPVPEHGDEHGAEHARAPSTGTSTSPSPNGSPDASPDASPTSDYQILLTKIPSAVRGQSGCPNAGTSVGATAVIQCAGLHGLGAGTIVYYLFPSPAALATGFSNLLKKQANFRKSRECTTNNKFTDFLVNCESDFTSATPNVKGSIAEYINTKQSAHHRHQLTAGRTSWWSWSGRTTPTCWRTGGS